MVYINKLTLKTKLLVYEYKEKYPSLTPEYIADLFNLNQLSVINLFKEGEIIVNSKMNK